jgi:L-ascorbate metabolism protein UlaG (beta-lactamase superfamily)
MLPEEAVVAAHILRARMAVPIHYGSLHEPPGYMETPRAAEHFLERAKAVGVVPRIVNRGEWFSPEYCDSVIPHP